jgi:hypothetical protein
MWACVKSHTNIVCNLLKHAKVDVNLQNPQGDTALSLASKIGHTALVVEMMKHDNVDVNIQNNHGWYSLNVGKQTKPYRCSCRNDEARQSSMRIFETIMVGQPSCGPAKPAIPIWLLK